MPIRRLTDRARDLTGSLAFIPAVFLAGFALLAIGLVELDDRLQVTPAWYAFRGDASAARTVLSVIAGSLITVAGLTFSITMVALQLASSQFSPRVLRTFFADRLTQVTIGGFVGTFVYALLVLRSVSAGFVPRLSIAVATLLGIAAVLLLIAFLHHVAQMIQVSHIMGAIAHDTLRRLDHLYPGRYGEPEDAAEHVLERWCEEPAGAVHPDRPGYVQRVELDALAHELARDVDRVAILVCPGDFASLGAPLALVWPAGAAERCVEPVRDAIPLRRERDLEQDVDFGLRQLTDTALKAISPGVNDPATAVTCIGYLRSILVRLAGRALPEPVRRSPDHELTVVLRRRGFDEYLSGLRQLGRYASGDPWVATEALGALEACASAAMGCGALDRAEAALALAETLASQAEREAGNERDRADIRGALAAVVSAATPAASRAP